MNPITAIAIRRIKRNLGKSILLSVAMLVLILLISFFSFFAYRTNILLSSAGSDSLPIKNFTAIMMGCMRLTAVILTIITLITLCFYINMRREDNRQILSVLLSVGATSAQKNGIIFTEILLLYLPWVMIGAFGGIFLAEHFAVRFVSIFSDIKFDFGILHILAVLMFVLFGTLIPILIGFLPDRRCSVISKVKNQNKNAAKDKHSYRQSRTFNSMNILQKLAKKCTDYYSQTYRSISVSFSIALTYPLLGLMLFLYMTRVEVTLDTNPFDGIDTVNAVMDIVGGLTSFFVICFLILTFVGVVQTVSMIKFQNMRRRKSGEIYLRIGLDGSDFKRMMKYEHRSVILRSAVAFIIIFAVINALYFMVCG